MSKTKLIYEVNLQIDPHIADEFDEWLKEHIEAMLDFDGFEWVEILDDEEKTRDGRIQRCTQYHVRDRAALDDYLENHARGMRAAGVEKFGAQFDAERRILEIDTHLDADALGELSECMNCSSPISGQYCSNCGQRSRVRLITMWELFRDLFADLFEFDSRLWRSLIPLLFRPGKLTVEYLRGRRMRYVPPFRMYLIVSILFFLVSTFGADLNLDGVEINGDGQNFEEAINELEQDIANTSDPDEIADLQKQIDAVKTARQVAENFSDEELSEDTDSETVDEEKDDEVVQEDAGEETDADDDEPSTFAEGCDEWEITIINNWVTNKIGGEERVRAACRKMADDNFAGFLEAMLDNLPKMMFFFLPLLAIILKVLYLFSRRFYVEHLLFFVHYHAFFFLLITIIVILNRLSVVVGVPDEIMELLTTGVIFYIWIYLYKSMRRVYEQGHLATIFKFLVLKVSYFFCLVAMLVMTATFTALTL